MMASTYADITFRDPSRIKRWLQRRRLSDAIGILRSIRRGSGRIRILDFGAGNGELVRLLSGDGSVEASVFEPSPGLMAEARENLAGLDHVEFIDRLDAVEPRAFDAVFCLEVLEHLPMAQTTKAIDAIRTSLRPGGIALIGVPHELFLPAILKGAFRFSRRRGEFDARLANVILAAIGRPPTMRPVVEICESHPYHPHHLGFDHRILERLLRQRFCRVRRWFSPFPAMGAALNSEVCFVVSDPVADVVPQG
jgi:SAM-dependent methyltransferase